MKTKHSTKLIIGAACSLLLAGFHTNAQNLFVGTDGGSSNNIVEISGGTQTTFATGLNYPLGLAFDSSGDLFAADQFSGHIYEWAGAGSTRTTFESGLNQPNYMAFDSSGNMFVSVGGTAIDEFNTSGALIKSYTVGLSNVTGIAFNSAGDLFISNDNGHGNGAGYITEIAGGIQSIFATGLTYPEGLAFNAAGDLFVINGNQSSQIIEITPQDVQTTFASGLNIPSCIAFDHAGDMFVADAGTGPTGDLTEFDSNGNVINVNTSISKPISLAFQGETLPVPEPSEYALFGLGAVALAAWSQKKKPCGLE